MLSSRINIGKLDRRITFYNKSISRGASNSEVVSWSEGQTVWANVVNNSGSEIVEADKVTFVRTTKFNVRYRDVDVESRILLDEKVFEIVSVVEPKDGRRGMLEIIGNYLEGEVLASIGAFSLGFSAGFNI
jgi:SPP1 family predicted phage head-tail adaptor